MQPIGRHKNAGRKTCAGVVHGDLSEFNILLGADGPVIIDLSADYRFDPAWYYGLPELTRRRYTGQKRIANPGCYASAKKSVLSHRVFFMWLGGSGFKPHRLSSLFA